MTCIYCSILYIVKTSTIQTQHAHLFQTALLMDLDTHIWCPGIWMASTMSTRNRWPRFGGRQQWIWAFQRAAPAPICQAKSAVVRSRSFKRKGMINFGLNFLFGSEEGMVWNKKHPRRKCALHRGYCESSDGQLLRLVCPITCGCASAQSNPWYKVPEKMERFELALFFFCKVLPMTSMLKHQVTGHGCPTKCDTDRSSAVSASQCVDADTVIDWVTGQNKGDRPAMVLWMKRVISWNHFRSCDDHLIYVLCMQKMREIVNFNMSYVCESYVQAVSGYPPFG